MTKVVNTLIAWMKIITLEGNSIDEVLDSSSMVEIPFKSDSRDNNIGYIIRLKLIKY